MTGKKSRFTDEEKKYLLKLARDSIKAFMTDGKILAPKTDNKKLKEDAGVFVTLEEYGQLRGCIGYIGAVQPLYLAVRDNAINAAFEDPRFPAVTVDELDNIEIEISVLTKPELIDAKSPEEYLEKIRPGVDGLILEYKGRSATYLPQVWEQLPQKEEFLSSLCNKAGLPSSAWKEKGAKIFKYVVEAFKESEFKIETLHNKG
jgi:AmmeMemoRadiSam system protein A